MSKEENNKVNQVEEEKQKSLFDTLIDNNDNIMRKLEEVY